METVRRSSGKGELLGISYTIECLRYRVKSFLLCGMRILVSSFPAKEGSSNALIPCRIEIIGCRYILAYDKPDKFLCAI